VRVYIAPINVTAILKKIADGVRRCRKCKCHFTAMIETKLRNTSSENRSQFTLIIRLVLIYTVCL